MILRRNNIITPSIKLCLFFANLVKTQALLGVVLYWLKLCRSNQRAMCFLRVVLRSCAFFDLGVLNMSKAFGDNLRQLRLKKGYTQAELATLLNIDRTTLTKYERGLTEPDFIRLKLICEILNVDYNTILQK